MAPGACIGITGDYALLEPYTNNYTKQHMVLMDYKLERKVKQNNKKGGSQSLLLFAAHSSR